MTGMTFSSIVFSRRVFALALVVLILGLTVSTHAQNRIRITHKVDVEARSGAPYLGRDLWFAIPQNADELRNSKKKYTVFVTAEKNTVVNIQQPGKAIIKLPVTAGIVQQFDFNPGATELHSSSVVDETRGIHVWSDNADLSVYFLSRNDYTSDGMFVIPSIGWGKEYVVASYSALSVDPRYDYPSEFVVCANQDNTIINVIPTADIREDHQPNVVKHAKGIPFTEFLKRGEVVQYMTTNAKDDSYDLTGTVVTSNNPIGVIGASQCPFVPVDAPYCDHILDMIPPVRTWARTYYSVPFTGRKYGGDTYLVVASQDGQVIDRNGSPFATLDRFGKYFNNDVLGASAWTSSAPFMLVQYINSGTYAVPPGKARNEGDPAMAVINPAEQFAKKVVFQTPTITSTTQPKFFNYVNILLPVSSEPNTTYDGKKITNPGTGIQVNKLAIPGTGWEGIRLTYTTRGTGEGTHTVKSDTGVGVYVYGYSTDDSYAWAGALGTKTPNDPDTLPPLVLTPSDCFCATVSTSDVHPFASKLSSVVTDTLANADFFPDPNFIPGSGADSTYYQFCVIDSTQEAYISVSIYDIAGNRTTVTSVYQPRIAAIVANPYNFGTGTAGVKKPGVIYIKNLGKTPFHYDPSQLSLKNGGNGFVIDDPNIIQDIPVGDSIPIKVHFEPLSGATVRDTVLVGDECMKTRSELLGNGGAPDFLVNNYDFDCAPINVEKKSIDFRIYNPSGTDVTIDTIWVEDVVHFGYNRTTPAVNNYPFVVPKQNLLVQGDYSVEFTFTPNGPGNFKSAVHFINKKFNLERIDTLFGKGCSPLTITRDSIQDMRCDGQAVFVVPINNVGSQPDTIISITGTGPALFTQPTFIDYVGKVVTFPYVLVNDVTKTKGIFATVVYTSPLKASGPYVDPIVVTRKDGSVATTATLTVNANYAEGTVDQNIDFGTVPFGAPKREDFIQFCNNSQASLIVTDVQKLVSTYASSFDLSPKYEVNGSAVTLPATLQPTECIKIYVKFDPSVSPETGQFANFEITTDACINKYPAISKGSISQGVPVVLGFTTPTVLSCTNLVDSITVINPTGSAREVRAIGFNGPNAANFVYQGAYPITIPVNASVKIPIRFLPNAAMNVVSYSANVKVSLHDLVTNVDYTDSSAPIRGFAAGIDFQVTSIAAQLQAAAGEDVVLPVNLSVTKQAGVTTPIDVLDITKIEIVYTYKTELLDIKNNDPIAAFSNLPNSWSIDPNPANTYLDQTGNKLKYTLIGGPLSDNITKLGNITFKAMLTKNDSNTDITLVSSKFFTSKGVEVAPCLRVADVDSNFTLIYRCGDATLQKLMRDNTYKPSVIVPASPNPVTKGFVTLGYATRFEGTVSLTIYDELGKVVGTPISDVRLPGGMYEVRYDVSKFGSGTYTYRLALDKYVTSSRFVVQK